MMSQIFSLLIEGLRPEFTPQTEVGRWPLNQLAADHYSLLGPVYTTPDYLRPPTPSQPLTIQDLLYTEAECETAAHSLPSKLPHF